MLATDRASYHFIEIVESNYNLEIGVRKDKNHSVVDR